MTGEECHRIACLSPTEVMKGLLSSVYIVLSVLPYVQPFLAAPTSTSTASTWHDIAAARSWNVLSSTSSPVKNRVRPGALTALAAAEKLAVSVGDVKRALSAAQGRLRKNRELFDEAKLKGELEYLEGVSSEAEFWNDGANARKTLSELNRYISITVSIRSTELVRVPVLWAGLVS